MSLKVEIKGEYTDKSSSSHSERRDSHGEAPRRRQTHRNPKEISAPSSSEHTSHEEKFDSRDRQSRPVKLEGDTTHEKRGIEIKSDRLELISERRKEKTRIDKREGEVNLHRQQEERKHERRQGEIRPEKHEGETRPHRSEGDKKVRSDSQESAQRMGPPPRRGAFRGRGQHFGRGQEPSPRNFPDQGDGEGPSSSKALTRHQRNVFTRMENSKHYY